VRKCRKIGLCKLEKKEGGHGVLNFSRQKRPRGRAKLGVAHRKGKKKKKNDCAAGGKGEWEVIGWRLIKVKVGTREQG